MASNNNQKNNPNQPRRKRNKKPVKRYSEEYSNRPNPYTGYSADGNYHPNAKKRPMSEASAVQTSRDAEEARRMADAAWPPASGGFVPPTVNIPAPKWATAESVMNQQLPSQAKQAPQEPAHTPSTSVPVQPADAVAPQHSEMTDGGENAVNGESKAGAPSQPPHRSGSHRRKHTDREAARKAKTAKMEAKKAALDKIAKGVAAHSVSEQMIDDISSMSDAIESMAKTEKTRTAEGGVNWDEFYDAAFPPRETDNHKESEKRVKAKQRVDFGEDASSDDVMPVKPVLLDDDEPLPYDKIAKENEREAQTTQDNAQEKMPAAAESRPLHPSDLIPVLDFDKRKQDFAEDMAAPEDMAGDVIEDVSAVTIEEVLQAVEREKREAADRVNVVSKSTEFAVGAMAFDSDHSEGWHEIAPPPSEEDVALERPVGEDSSSLLSQRLLESYMELENQIEEESENPPSEEAEDEIIPQVDINALLHTADRDTPDENTANTYDDNIVTAAEPEQPSDTVAETQSEVQEDNSVTEVSVTEPETPADEPAKQPVDVSDVVSVDIDISEIEDEIFAETEAIAPEELEGTREEEEPVSGEDAVKEKLEKLVEAAELAEVLRQESEDTLPTEEQPGIQLPSEDLSVTPEVTKADGEDEVVKPYQPREKATEDGDKVFESILIVDDNQKVLDPAISKEQDDTLYLHAKGTSENPTAVFRLPDGPIVLPTDFDDADFQEQWLDEDEDGDEMASRTKRARRRVSAFIGAVVIVFAALILVSVVKTVVTGFNNLGGTGEKKMEYTEFIAPVVLNDPAPFESIEKADNQMLLESSIWRVLDEMRKTEGYEYTYDATKKIVIAADQVEQAGRELFGSEVQLNMNVLSESDGSAIYYYDSIENTFHISEGGVMGPTAIITRMAQKSDRVTLVVGYISQEEMTLTSSEGEPECYKYMEYVLTLKPNGSYYIQSIRNYVEE